MEHTFLILEDGMVFQGTGFGKAAPAIEDLLQAAETPTGEVVFNTSMCGYPEILTDPSYNGQLIVMTYPHIGNYGVDPIWSENMRKSSKVPCVGFICHDYYTGFLPPDRISLGDYMAEHGVCGLYGIDTRTLTLRLRDKGSCKGILVRTEEMTDFRKTMVMEFLSAFPSITDRDLITDVSTGKTIQDPTCEIPVPTDTAAVRFALVDFGIKKSIIQELYKRNAKVTLFPPTVTADEILASGCDSLFLSNGPGDPARLQGAVEMTRKVIGKMPVCGICLGHQLITWALGGRTVKMKFGHHGANQPVTETTTGKTFVTSQNHGFMSERSSLPKDVEIWFTNANDGSIEGIRQKKLQVQSVQFHPEASPGPQDGRWIFDLFIKGAKK
ncbi:MAG: glutamine-hydrolyzing carbamoyl-phosphate synthase small subunit [Spirochaetia bacterium]|jgi:carbamoyl-phosphate synthase small subunit|nr:glutamine-hydrolyzing carbamoyl-phosphate synthase small subunit [Spirochaetia bacterium]